MKKSFKMLALSFLVLPCFFVFTACGDPRGSEVDLAENYTKLTAASQALETKAADTQTQFFLQSSVSGGMKMNEDSINVSASTAFNYDGTNFYSFIDTAQTMKSGKTETYSASTTGSAIVKDTEGNTATVYSWDGEKDKKDADFAYSTKTKMLHSQYIAQNLQGQLDELMNGMGGMGVTMPDLSQFTLPEDPAQLTTTLETTIKNALTALNITAEVNADVKAYKNGEKYTFTFTLNIQKDTDINLTVTLDMIVDKGEFAGINAKVNGKMTQSAGAGPNAQTISIEMNLSMSMKLNWTASTDAKYTSVPTGITWDETDLAPQGA